MSSEIVGKRLVYANAQVALAKAGLSLQEIANAQLSQSYLRLEVPLNTTQNSFTFNVQVTQNTNQTQSPTEQRLTLQDAFFASSIMLYVGLQTGSATSSVKLYTFPSTVFGSDVAGLQTIYNGKLLLSVNNTTTVPAFPCSKFQTIPQTQLTAATNSPTDEYDGSKMCVLEPNWTFIGSKNNVLVLQLPGNLASVTGTVKAVVVMEGVLAQNVTLVS